MAKARVKVAQAATVAETQPSPLAVPGTVIVVFKRDHRHAGVDYRANDTLEVTTEVADLLRQYDAIGSA
jgi:hypothetical protein